jgi:tRNA dimethylallyltransferase
LQDCNYMRTKQQFLFDMKHFNLISIIGATATGKTGVAAHLAKQIGGEIISADSRQVYRGMSIGTGKDLDEYVVDGVQVPYHLIDIVDAGYQYNVFEYQRDFVKVFEEITPRGNMPVLCGGSGMYVEAVLKGYRLINVPVDQELRDSLAGKTLNELTNLLGTYKKPHNVTDTDTVKRAIRAIEIEEYYFRNAGVDEHYPEINSLLVGIMLDRDTRRKRISERLKCRLKNGMVEEVEALLNQGLSPEVLVYYGLEYKYITQYVVGQLSFDQMFKQLETAIHQFSKRQMTWFRRMEKQGFEIHWIDGEMPLNDKVGAILQLIDQS